jgi:hypothetical protein
MDMPPIFGRRKKKPNSNLGSGSKSPMEVSDLSQKHYSSPYDGNMHIVPKNHDVELAFGFTSRYSVFFLFSLFFFFYNGGH